MQTSHTETTSPAFARRCAALAYDSLLLIALWMAVSALVLALSGGWLAEPNRPLWLVYALRVPIALVTGLFFAGFWTHGGQTLGMRAWRLRLISSDYAGRVSWKQALIRLVAACLSAGALGLGFFWVLIDRQQRSWHDHVSGTHLILLKPPETMEVARTREEFPRPEKKS